MVGVEVGFAVVLMVVMVMEAFLAFLVLEEGLTRWPWRGSKGGSTSGSISSLVIA